MIKKILIAFLKGWLPPDVKETAYKAEILCRGFLEPILDNGEMYAKWIDFNNKHRAEILQHLCETTCPYRKCSCTRESCSAYRDGFTERTDYEPPLSERMIAKLEGREPRQYYRGHFQPPFCKKKVF